MQTYLDKFTPRVLLLLAVPVFVIASSVTTMMSAVFHTMVSNVVRNVLRLM